MNCKIIKNEFEKIYIFSSKTIKVNFDGSKSYFNKKGQLHNDVGPAFILSSRYKEYWINGKQINEKKFKEYKKNKIIKDNLKKLKIL